MNTRPDSEEIAAIDFAHLTRLGAELDSGEPGDDPVAELLAVFERNSRRLATHLRDLAASGDALALAAAAHQLVSASGWVGAMPLSAHARAIEAAAHEGRMSDAERLVAVALAELERVYAAVAARGAEGPR